MKLSNQRPTQGHGKIELSMTSMIDVVFLLLIFFLVTTTFIKPERQVSSGISANDRSSSAHSNVPPLLIEIVQVADVTTFRLGAVVTSELAELENTLLRVGRDGNQDENVFVRVGPDIPFEKAAQVIGLCRASGFDNVVYVPNRIR